MQLQRIDPLGAISPDPVVAALPKADIHLLLACLREYERSAIQEPGARAHG